MHRIIKRRHSALNGTLGIRKRNNGIAVLLSRIVKVHLADLLPGSLLNQISVDMKLSAIMLQAVAHLYHIRLAFRFEVYQFNRTVNTAHKVNFTLNDVIRLYKADINLRLPDGIPFSILSLGVPQNLFQCRQLLRFGKVGMLGLNQGHIVAFKPLLDFRLVD